MGVQPTKIGNAMNSRTANQQTDQLAQLDFIWMEPTGSPA